MTTKLLTVPHISCEHCEHTIHGALDPLPGVRALEVDIPTHRVSVEFDESQSSLERIKEVLLEEEYPVAAVV